jgi:hypothetical protein
MADRHDQLTIAKALAYAIVAIDRRSMISPR